MGSRAMSGMRYTVGFAALLLTAATVSGQCEYEVTKIRCPGYPWPPETIGMGLNNLGHVVGYCFFLGVDTAFLWRPETGFETLDFPPGTELSRAYDLNDAGQIVGSFGSSGSGFGNLAFLRDGGEFTNLGTFPGATYSEALAINEAGQIVGQWGNNVTGDPAKQAFVWDDGQMIDLGPSLGTPNGSATDINDAGQITGWRGEASWTDARAYIWDAGNVTDLGAIPDGHTSNGNAINELGHVAGRGIMDESECTVPVWHAFLWDGQGMSDLGALSGHLRSRANGINDAGQVVGMFDSHPNCSAIGGFIWQNGVMTPLDNLIPPEAGLEWVLAADINNVGQIVGTGWEIATGADVAVLLSPPRPVPGDLDFDCAVGIADFLLLLAAWGPCPDPPAPCLADLDGDGNVGITDFLSLLGNWG
jgi:probable HAF family extracellular repeat protein